MGMGAIALCLTAMPAFSQGLPAAPSGGDGASSAESPPPSTMPSPAEPATPTSDGAGSAESPLTAGATSAAAAALPSDPTTAEATPAQPGSPSRVGLDEALAAARAHGPSLKVVRLTLEIARAQLAQTKAKEGLALSGSASYFHEDNLPNQPQPSTSSLTSGSSAAAQAAATAAQAAIEAGTAAPVGENLEGALKLSGPATSLSLSAHLLFEGGSLHDQVATAALTGSQTLYDGYPGGRANAAVEEAEYSYQIAQISYEASALQIAYQVKQAYYTLLGAQEAVLVQQSSVDEAEEDLNRVKGFLAAGEATRLDLLQAEVALRQAQLSLRAAENLVIVDRKNLSSAVGWPLDRVYEVAGTGAPRIRTANEREALDIAFANRPELKELALDVASGQVALGLAKSQYLPVVSLAASLSLNADLTTNYTAGSYSAGISVSMPIFEDGLLAAGVRQAHSQLDSLALQQAQERESITISVQSALFSVTQDEANLAAARQSLLAAQGQYALEKAKFTAGLATNLDVLTASAALRSAQSAVVQANTAYILAILNLDNALGI